MAYLRTADNNFGVAKFIVGSTYSQGVTHITLASAVSDATSGDTIYVRPGSYDEDFTIDSSAIKDLNFVCLEPNYREITSKPEIIGKISITRASKVGFFGFKFTTDSDNSFLISGNSAGVTCENCYFNASNANSFSITVSSGNLYLDNCSGTFASTRTLFVATGGLQWIKSCLFYDASGTLTASSNSTSVIRMSDSIFRIPFSTSDTGFIEAVNCQFGTIVTPFDNVTFITTAGSVSSYLYHCQIYSGSQSAISVGSGTTVNCYLSEISSSNTNAITGAGTFNSDAISYVGSSTLNNVTTRGFVTHGEKNTWTPALTFGGGSTGLTYSGRSGSYTRIGNVITFTMSLELSAKGSSTGTAAITGLPYNAASTSIFTISADSLTFTGSLNARIPGGSSTISLDVFPTGGARTQLSDTAFVNATYVQISGTYLA